MEENARPRVEYSDGHKLFLERQGKGLPPRGTFDDWETLSAFIGTIRSDREYGELVSRFERETPITPEAIASLAAAGWKVVYNEKLLWDGETRRMNKEIHISGKIEDPYHRDVTFFMSWPISFMDAPVRGIFMKLFMVKGFWNGWHGNPVPILSCCGTQYARSASSPWSMIGQVITHLATETNWFFRGETPMDGI